MKTFNLAFCFDHNYVLPACVSIYSLLSHVLQSNENIYKLHIIGSDLTVQDKNLICGVVTRFHFAKILFVNPPNIGVDVVSVLKGTHFSKALFYKLLIPNLIADAERVMMLDVDTVYQDDITVLFEEVAAQDDFYIAGAWDTCYVRWHFKGLEPDGKICLPKYRILWTAEERDWLKLNAGLMVLNCKRLREDGIVEKWITAVKHNLERLTLPEQDVMNLVCKDKVVPLSWRCMAYSYYYPKFETLSDKEKSENNVWCEMFNNPVQIHYAQKEKPWMYPGLPLSELWIEECCKAGLLTEWLDYFDGFSKEMYNNSGLRNIVKVAINFFKRKFIISIDQDVGYRVPSRISKKMV